MADVMLQSALIKVNKTPKLILEVETEYKGCIFTDTCNLIGYYSDNVSLKKNQQSIQCLTHALKAFTLFSKYKGSDLSKIHPNLLEIVKCPSNSAELTLVSATAWAKVICESCTNTCDARKTLLEEVENFKNDDIVRVSLLGGLLNCGYKEVIANITFLVQIFEIIQKVFSGSTGQMFQTFQVFKTWSNRLKEIDSLSEEEKSKVISENNLIHSATVAIINNWESPIRGVPDHLEDTLTNILEFLEKSDTSDFISQISHMYQTNVEGSSWKSKGKYRILNVIIPKMGVSKLIERDSTFASCLFLSLSSNHLVSVGVTVYKTILKDITLEQWRMHFLQPLVDCLLNQTDDLVQTNANTYLIPTTVKMIPSAGNVIFSNLSSLPLSNQSWQAILNVLKNQRLLGHVDQLSQTQLLSVEKGLIHTKHEIRISAFSVLCLSNKRGTPPTCKEMQMIHDFIVDNLTVSDASFRQMMKSNFVQVMTRCRDYVVTLHRKIMKKSPAQVQQTGNQDEEKTYNSAMIALINQLDNILESLFMNLFPGANYQRLISSLELLSVFDSCFFNYEASKGLNKGSANGDPSKLIQYVHRNFNFLNMYTKKEHCEALLSCSLYYMEDVRQNAIELLKNFKSDHAPRKEIVIRTALELACSPKFAECESSALLFSLSIHWLGDSERIWAKDLKAIKLKEQYSILSKTIMNISENKPNEKHLLSQLLLYLYDNLINQAVSDNGKEFLQYAKSTPMHGILTALRICLPKELPSKIIPPEYTPFITTLIYTASKSASLMLSILSGNNEKTKDDAASFADMGIAIDSMIVDTPNELENNSVEEEYSISDEHSLILACIWLNLKSCSLMAAQIISTYTLDYENSYRCAKLLSDILTKCRHKGAMENAMFAMEKVCNTLMDNDDPNIRDIPQKILTEVLNDLDCNHSISLTRRSAGLPMLILKIVASEHRGVGGKARTLLVKAIQKLIVIADKPIDHASEIFDMPQSHALHILRVLVHDRSLSSDILKYCDEILMCCVNHFSSDSWSIRFQKITFLEVLIYYISLSLTK